MAQYFYAITMKTPLGDRRGSLLLDCEDGQCRGILSLLGTKTGLRGTLDETGRCELRGELRTLLRSLPYLASGTLLPDRLTLTLVAGGHGYPIDGQRRDTL